MILKSPFLTLAFLLFAFAVSAQQNPLLSRDFWKQKPSVNTVMEKIKEGHDPAQFNSNAFDPTVYAILENAPMETVQILLKQDGNDVNKITHDGRTYIFWAAYANNLPLMKYLVDNGAKTNLVDDKGLSVLNFTARSGVVDKAIYDYIFAQGVDAKTDKDINGANALLLFSPSAKNREMTDYFLEKGLTLSDKDNAGSGVFHYAAKGGNTSFLDYLIAAGVDYKSADNNGKNAMHFAAMGMRGHTNSRKVFEYLESKGIDPNARANDGSTPLSEYLKGGDDAAVVQYFLSKGADPDFANKDGNTAMMIAAEFSSPELVRTLLTKTQNVNASNKKGRTAFMFAVKGNTTEVMRLLIAGGARPDATDADGNNAVYYLAQSYSPKTVKDFSEKVAILEENGVMLKSEQAKGNTFYHFAARQNEMELLEMANQKGLDVNAKNAEGLTPLHIAAMKAGNPEPLKYLLANGADKGIHTDFDESAYQLAGENELLKDSKTDLQFLQN